MILDVAMLPAPLILIVLVLQLFPGSEPEVVGDIQISTPFPAVSDSSERVEAFSIHKEVPNTCSDQDSSSVLQYLPKDSDDLEG
ncbi:hypothetical protein B0H12DRAFT_376872 [Mycena haematopus]|nr:hypothetical protein B0H12DRAFT_376872 [Mycena haematopus]